MADVRMDDDPPAYEEVEGQAMDVDEDERRDENEPDGSA